MRAVFTDIHGELQCSEALDQRRLVEVTPTEVLRALTMAGDAQWSHALDGALNILCRLVALDLPWVAEQILASEVVHIGTWRICRPKPPLNWSAGPA